MKFFQIKGADDCIELIITGDVQISLQTSKGPIGVNMTTGVESEFLLYHGRFCL